MAFRRRAYRLRVAHELAAHRRDYPLLVTRDEHGTVLVPLIPFQRRWIEERELGSSRECHKPELVYLAPVQLIVQSDPATSGPHGTIVGQAFTSPQWTRKP